MSEEKIKSIIREFVEATAKGDVDKAISFCADDVVWFLPEGTFKGKNEVKRYLTWLSKNSADRVAKDSGIGLIVKDNTATYRASLARYY